MLNKVMLSLCIVSLLVSTGCATIVSKSNYPVSVASKPSEVKFNVINSEGEILFSGKTPTVVNLKAADGFLRSARYEITFEKEGYQTTTRNINSTIDEWYFGNLISFTLMGLLIDSASGAMWKIDKDVYIELIPEE